ncbi:unnamed protein product, partial [Sphacelaria rigidula]
SVTIAIRTSLFYPCILARLGVYYPLELRRLCHFPTHVYTRGGTKKIPGHTHGTCILHSKAKSRYPTFLSCWDIPCRVFISQVHPRAVRRHLRDNHIYQYTRQKKH